MKSSKQGPTTKKPSSADSGGHGNALNANFEGSLEDLEVDFPIVIFPEWSDADIASEKWSTKHAFEDSEFPLFFPRSLRKDFESYKRPSELVTDGLTPVVVMPLASLDDSFRGRAIALGSKSGLAMRSHGSIHSSSEQLTQDVNLEDNQTPSNANPEKLDSLGESTTKPTTALAEEEPLAPDMGENASEAIVIEEPVPLQESYSNASKFFQANQHLLKSELMTSILGHYHFMYESSKTQLKNGVPDEFSLWDNIYPKNKDGTPMYNPSGKYAVKLFWLGAWRKILVDDRLPMSAAKKPMLITSPVAHELWPYLLCKAIIKIASYRYSY